MPSQLVQMLTTAQFEAYRRPEIFAMVGSELVHGGASPEEFEVASTGAGGAPAVLRGWLFRGRPGAPLVLFSHGIHSCRIDMGGLCSELAAGGINAACIDGRAHGLSGGEYITFGYHERHDLLTALAQLRSSCGGGPGVLAGLSLGGAVSVLAADDPMVAGVIAVSTYWDFRACFQRFLMLSFAGLDEATAASAIERVGAELRIDLEAVDPSRRVPRFARHPPLLLIHGGRDELIPAEQARALRAAWGGPVEWHLIDRGGHADVLGLPETEELIGAFVRRLAVSA